MKKTLLSTLYILLSLFCLEAQEVKISGTVFDNNKEPLAIVNIQVEELKTGTVTDKNGKFTLTLPENKSYILKISHLSFETQFRSIGPFSKQEVKMDFMMQESSTTLNEVSVHAKYQRVGNQQKIDVKSIDFMPQFGGGVESLVKTLPGVSSTSELSNQYFVRGGNFDENLVYVNDFEIHRPFLVKSGEQEGLSFINSDLISSITFSAGGFESKYGDKMSSVLDITYKTPTDFNASASLSLLGATAHVEGISGNRKFTYLAGARYKTNAYLLGTMDTEGDYQPAFSDFQGLFSYQLSKRLDLSALLNFSDNVYNFVPGNRETSFGTFNNVKQFTMYFEGQERDRFTSSNIATSLNYRPTDNTILKLIGTYFRTYETISYDILGQYWINQVDNSFGSDTYGDSIASIAVGTLLDHARDLLIADVYTLEHKGGWYKGKNNLKWGVKYQYEDIYDKINEWEMIDSADFNTPYMGDEIELSWVAKNQNQIYAHRFSGFIQDAFDFNTTQGKWNVNIGSRFNYWSYNQEFLISPRASVSIEPYWKRKVIFFLSGGVYHQPPFYKELRNAKGAVNPNIEAQRSIHIVAGNDIHFIAWNRPFKITSEAYYKKLDNLIPYKIDNVQTIYMGQNVSSGYATGIDFKLNGEFVKDAESWLSLSVMKTEEDIKGDFTMIDGEINELGYFPRPSDRRVNANLFFQDYLPNFPAFRVHLNVLFASGLPLSSSDKTDFYNQYHIPPYKRVDIGFSYMLKNPDKKYDNRFLNSFKSVQLTAELFNMLNINNTISYMWVETVTGSIYAIPNYLTGRRLNFKVSVKF